LVAVVATRGKPGVTAPAGWKLIRSDDNSTTMRQGVWTHRVTDQDPETWTWKFSTAVAAAGSVVGYRGVDTASPVNETGGQPNPASKTITTPALTSAANGLVVGLFGIAQTATIDQVSPLRERAEATTPATQYKVTVSAGDMATAAGQESGPLTATASQKAASVGQYIVLAPTS
jgi:hypothetical protein